MSMAQARQFYVAAFATDGVMEGKGCWDNRNLSDEWRNVCKELLREKGASFEHCWTGPLSHLSMKFTSAKGSAICTFFVYEHVASSILMLRGDNPTADREVAQSFVDSLRAALTKPPNVAKSKFFDVINLPERPLLAVVPIPNESISDQNHDLVRELAIHFASGFFEESDPVLSPGGK